MSPVMVASVMWTVTYLLVSATTARGLPGFWPPFALPAFFLRPDFARCLPLLIPVFGRRLILPSRMRVLISSRVIADWTRSFSSGSIQTRFKPPPIRLAASLFWLFRLIQNSPRSCRDPRLQLSRSFLPSSPLPSPRVEPFPRPWVESRLLLVPLPFQDLQYENSDPWLWLRFHAASSLQHGPRS